MTQTWATTDERGEFLRITAVSNGEVEITVRGETWGRIGLAEVEELKKVIDWAADNGEDFA